MSNRIQFRRDTLENWQVANPILMEGELGLVATDSNNPNFYDGRVIGDGTHNFNDLEIFYNIFTTKDKEEISNKVDKVEGKQLSTNDFTNEDKAKLTDLPNKSDFDIELASKVDKIEGKILSSNDFTNEDKTKLNALPTKIELDTLLDNKADSTELSNIVGVPTEGEIENLEPTIITNALRKTEQSLTSEEQAQVKKNLGISEIKEFIAQVETAGATYNQNTGFFELNGLTDITESQMRLIYLNIQRTPYNVLGNENKNLLRTNLFLATGQSTSDNEITVSGLFEGWNSAEVLNVSNGYSFLYATRISNKQAFRNCRNLKSINGVFQLYRNIAAYSLPFQNCLKLEDVSIYAVFHSLSFEDSPLLSLASLEFLVEHATNTSPITITLHPDAYERLTDSLIASATAKDITFATV